MPVTKNAKKNTVAANSDGDSDEDEDDDESGEDDDSEEGLYQAYLCADSIDVSRGSPLVHCILTLSVAYSDD